MLRLLKQIIIALIFFALVGSAVYFFLTEDTPLPSPSPAVSVSPLLVNTQKLIKVGELDYDFLAEIKNPNFDFGASQAVYELNLFDSGGNPILTKKGSATLLPGQSGFEIVSPIKTEVEVSRAEFKIIDVTWERLSEFIPQNLFLVRNQEYSGAKFRGTLHNNSNFDFDRVDIFVVLYDPNNNAIAANKTDIRTMLARTDRYFEVLLSALDSVVLEREGTIEVSARTDVFKNGNFIKEHGTQEKFQRFY